MCEPTKKNMYNETEKKNIKNNKVLPGKVNIIFKLLLIFMFIHSIFALVVVWDLMFVNIFCWSKHTRTYWNAVDIVIRLKQWHILNHVLENRSVCMEGLMGNLRYTVQILG